MSMTIEEWRRGWNELQSTHVATNHAIDEEYVWMRRILWGCALLVPLPFFVIGWLRARKKVGDLQRHSEQIATAMAGGK